MVVSAIRNNFKEFFLRVASMAYKTALQKAENTQTTPGPLIKAPTAEV